MSGDEEEPRVNPQFDRARLMRLKWMDMGNDVAVTHPLPYEQLEKIVEKNIA